MLELYHYDNSICSERVRMLLFEKGIDDWVEHEVDLFKGEQFRPEYLKLNPKAQTPTLVHNGNIIRESAIICEYIDDVYPDPSFKPVQPEDVAQMREWIKTSDEQLYETVAALSFGTIFSRFMNEKGVEAKEAHFRKQTDLGRVMRQRSCVEEGFESEYLIRGVSNFIKLTEVLERQLSDGRPWVMGQQFTLVEINYAPFIARVEALAMLDLIFKDNPMVSRWWDNCKQRESFKVANVGPAKEDEIKRYREAGEAMRSELEKLIDRIHTTSIYDLTEREWK